MNYDDLIEFEPESTSLDFKATQYRKEQHHELLKDVIAMANADKEGEKIIITGVKKYNDGRFVIYPIPKEEFVDSATYQQFIISNIEPEIHIDYTPYLFKGSQLVGILKIPVCADKPYMMKKDFSAGKVSLKTGDSFIRKGTTTPPLARKDIDRIFEQKRKETETKRKPLIKVLFNGEEKIEISIPKNFKTNKALNKATYEYPDYLNYLAYKYYTGSNVDAYNKWFEANQEVVSKHNRIVTALERAKVHNKLFKITIVNQGNAIANKVNIKIRFPIGFFILESNKIKEFKEMEFPHPEGAPFHPLIRAENDYEKNKSELILKMDRSLYSVNVPDLSKLRSIHSPATFDISDRSIIDITLKDLLQTVEYKDRDFQFILAPTRSGNYSAKIELIHEELPEAQLIEIPISVVEFE